MGPSAKNSDMCQRKINVNVLGNATYLECQFLTYLLCLAIQARLLVRRLVIVFLSDIYDIK